METTHHHPLTMADKLALLAPVRKTHTASHSLDPDVQMELAAMMGESTATAPATRLSSATIAADSRRNGSPASKRNSPSAAIASRIGARSNGSATTMATMATAAATTNTSSPLAKRHHPAESTRTASPTASASAAAPRAAPLSAAVRHELEALLRRPAPTSEDKYRVLEARDKLIRLGTSTTHDLAAAVTTRGVCPDLCPEKERLMREATHHIASFELDVPAGAAKAALRHSLALKQYSRSSADQDAPLAHELRPEPVLQLTMQFLLHRVVDQCDAADANLADWFHFVWDRTRSIRKDLAQQELCSPGAVQLVEQCARFHIHCAGRLVAEEPQVFEPKINSENLTKCLQSLKYLYHDLELRGAARCGTEPEFRAYVILLNLNDCQFFWELKQLPERVLHSAEVRFALQVYMAVETRNYVRFFQLVRRTTYMNGCILLRYFTQVRMVALQTMLKAYAPRQLVAMQLSYWQYVLAFEDAEQTAQFFEYNGLRCDRAEDRVWVGRATLCYPETPFWLERAINVVEHKRKCSVGQAIWGADSEMPEFAGWFERYEPHDSFDERGVLLRSSWLAEDQNWWRPVDRERRRRERSVSVAQVEQPVEEEEEEEELAEEGELEEEEQIDLVEDGEDEELAGELVTNDNDHDYEYDDADPEEEEDYARDYDYPDETDQSNGQYITASTAIQTIAAPEAPSVFKMPALPALKPIARMASPQTTSQPPQFPAAGSSAASIFGGQAFGGAAAAEGSSSSGSNIFGSVVVPPQIGGAAAKEASSIFANNGATSAFSLPLFGGSYAGAGGFAAAPEQRVVEVDGGHSIFGGFVPVAAKTSPANSRPPSATSIAIPAKSAQPPPTTALRRRDSLDREQLAAANDAQLAAERQQLLLSQSAHQLLNSLLTEHIALECRQHCATLQLDQRALQLAQLLLDELAEEQIRAELASVQLRLAQQHQSVASKYFRRWVHLVDQRRRRRQRLAVTPLWITADVDRALLVPGELRAPQQQETLRQRRRYRLGLAGKHEQKEKQSQSPSQHRLPMPEPPIDVAAIVAAAAAATAATSGPHRPATYWKCLLALPADSDRLQRWLHGIFLRRSSQPPAAQSPDVVLCERIPGDPPTSVCLRLLRGCLPQLDSSPAEAVRGANAIIFFVSSRESQAACERRLQSVQQLGIPCSVVLHKLRTDPEQLRHFAASLPVAGRHLHCDTADGGLRGLMADALQRLAERRRIAAATIGFRMQRSGCFLRDTLGSELWLQWLRSAATNAGFRRVCGQPGAVAAIYAEAVRRVAAACDCGPEADEVAADFAPEFRRFVAMGAGDLDVPLGWEHFPVGWRSEARAERLREFFGALELSGAGNLRAETVHEFVGQRFGAEPQLAAELGRRVQQILERQQRDGQERNWLEPMREMCLARLQQLFNGGSAQGSLPAEIIYAADRLQAFRQHPWWLEGDWMQQQQQPEALEADVRSEEMVAVPAIRRIDPAMLAELLQRGRELVDRADVSIRSLQEVAQSRKQQQQQVHISPPVIRKRIADVPADQEAEANRTKSPEALVVGAKKVRANCGAGAAADDLEAILARGRERLERAERTLERFYCSKT